MLVRLKNIVFGNKEIDETFIDGETIFILSHNQKEGFGGVFQNIFCRLIKTIKLGRRRLYLIETEQIFTGIDFGIKAVPVNKFFIQIRRPSNFKKDKETDVLVYLPNNIDNSIQGSLDEMKLIDWAIISNISLE